jgi:1-acyl-sn-glycerol-3-phosphate acyltransferase
MAGTLVIMGPFYIVWNLFTPGGYRSYPLSVLYIKICTLWMGLRIRATGRENLPHSGTCILMPNHRSWWDIPTVQIGAYPHQVRFVSKKEVGKIPLLGTCMTGGGHVLIDRGDRDSAVRTLRDAAARYKGRISLVLFPEGTRSPGHHLLRFKRGGFHLARELGLSIVPVSVAGGERIMKKGSFTILPGTMRVHYHAPIPVPKDADLNVISAAVREKIAAGLKEMGEYEEEPPTKEQTPLAAASAEAAPGALVMLMLALGFGYIVADGAGATTRMQREPFLPPPAVAEAMAAHVLADSLEVDIHDVIALDAAGQHLIPVGQGELGLVRATRSDPLRAPALVSGLGWELLNRRGMSPGGPALVAAATQGHPVDEFRVRVICDSAWARAARPAALSEAIATFYGGGKRLSGNERDALRRTVPLVPTGIARIAAYLLFVREEAARLHERAFSKADLARERLDRKNFDLDAMAWVDTLGEVPDRIEEVLLRVDDHIDRGALNGGAVLLSQAVDEASRHLSALPAEETSWPGRFIWDSPAGRIVLGGADSDEYRGPHLLILDVDGNDTYVGAGSARFPSLPIAMLIDRAGNDRYAPADSTGPGVGGALGGYAMVVDMAGDDEWRSWRLGLGAAIFGAGLVHDRGGADTYHSQAFSQGAAAWGFGVLADAAGNDRYRIGCTGQGFGAPGGVGILLDTGHAEEDSGDVYEVLPGESFATQGAGIGVQRARLGAPRLAGGVGVLIEVSGNDRYGADSRSLGVGSLDGLGAVLDISGDDIYTAHSTRCVGFGELGGVGVVHDVEGNDDYDANSYSLGVGSNGGVGIVLDRRGDDSYRLRDFGLGGCEDSGLGVFLDGSGEDRYTGWTGIRYAGVSRQSGGLRATAVFLDLAGDDQYGDGRRFEMSGATVPEPGNNRRWGTPNADLRFGESISIGLDVNGLPPE